MEIYLDNCATTKVCGEAVNACVQAMAGDYGNPSSLHKKGVEAEGILTSARKTVGKALNCDGEEVFFTANATESNNLALLGSARANPRGGRTIVITAVEHPSVENAAKALEETGYTVKRVFPRPGGGFVPEDFLEAVDSDTLLLSFMLVNNEIGTVLPYQRIIPEVKKRFPKLIVHVDGVQGMCRYPINLKRLGLDLFSFSGHKLYAPKGVGVLYVRKGVRLKPLVSGGGQEKGLRSGTQAVELIAGLDAALRLWKENAPVWLGHTAALNRRLREGLAGLGQVEINSPEDGAAHILNFSVLGVPSEIMLHFLESKKIFVSSGSACAKGEESAVLAAYGLPKERIRSALRVSFSKDNTLEDVDALLACLIEGAKRFRKMTGF